MSSSALPNSRVKLEVFSSMQYPFGSVEIFPSKVPRPHTHFISILLLPGRLDE
jgi:hypothetical protein